MKAVDPSVKLVGPVESSSMSAGGGFPWVLTSCVTSNGLNSPCTNGLAGWTSNSEYIPSLLSYGNPKPDVVSFHAYGGGSDTTENQKNLTTAGQGWGLNNQVPNYQGADQAAIASANVPVWITETNIDAGYSANPATGSDLRSMTQMGAAWLADDIIAWSFDPHVQKLFQYAINGEDASWALFGWANRAGDTSCVPQPACQNSRAGQPDLEYWSMYWINHWLTQGNLVPLTNIPSGFSAMAVQTGPHTVVALLVNKQQGNDDGNGAPGTVNLQLQGATVTDVQQITINGSTDWANGPTVTDLGAHSGLTINAAGYEVDLLKFTI
jgi:hypothetical protein